LTGTDRDAFTLKPAAVVTALAARAGDALTGPARDVVADEPRLALGGEEAIFTVIAHTRAEGAGAHDDDKEREHGSRSESHASGLAPEDSVTNDTT
jgi:hypothetical protein